MIDNDCQLNDYQQNIILEPGEQKPKKDIQNNIGIGCFYNDYQSNSSSSITNNNPFVSQSNRITFNDILIQSKIKLQNKQKQKKNVLSIEEQMHLQQKRALDKLKLIGDQTIGYGTKPKLSVKTSAKRKIKKIKDIKMVNVDIHSKLNDNTFGLNDSHLNYDGNSDTNYNEIIDNNLLIAVNASEAANDRSNAFTEEDHLLNRTVYVGGLHPMVKRYHLQNNFEHCGSILSLKLDFGGKGFGFITYSSHEEAAAAILDMVLMFYIYIDCIC